MKMNDVLIAFFLKFILAIQKREEINSIYLLLFILFILIDIFKIFTLSFLKTCYDYK